MRGPRSCYVATIILTVLMFSLITAVPGTAAIVADHNSVSQFDLIPTSVIEAIGADYEIVYTHTSHGSQIMTGISLIETENPLYDPPYVLEIGDDLGHNGDTSWVAATRAYLENPSYDFNMAMFSWCGGCSDNTETGINIYLNKMEELEADYPAVIFIYMTGHLDGGGPEGNLYARNNQIRAYCLANDKILFDFADIESYDPDGVWYPDASDACEWCYDWCAAYPCPSCGCAHSHCFNCYQKGKAWWWMMARISGWSPEAYEGPVWHVASDGSDLTGDGSSMNPFATIQHAIDQTVSGDTVLVAAGTYTGDGNHDLDFGGTDIVVMSSGGAAATIIDCEGSESTSRQGFNFHSGETASAILDGFTITGVWASVYSDSAAVYCESSSPTIRNCEITGNNATGLRIVDDCFPTVDSCIIGNNSGDGIWLGIMMWPPGSLTLSSSLIVDNSGHGVNVQDAVEFQFSGCTVAFNGESGILIQGDPPRTPIFTREESSISNSISAFNGDDGIRRMYWLPPIAMHCNDSYGNGGDNFRGVDATPGDVNGNISVDPLFCDTAARDLTLNEDSPCLPPGNICGVQIGFYGVGCTIPTCGNADGNSVINVSDAVYLIAYIFDGGPPPDPLPLGDADCNQIVNISDAVYLIAYIFGGGPEPCANCP